MQRLPPDNPIGEVARPALLALALSNQLARATGAGDIARCARDLRKHAGTAKEALQKGAGEASLQAALAEAGFLPAPDVLGMLDKLLEVGGSWGNAPWLELPRPR